jgi:hypothetical protein
VRWEAAGRALGHTLERLLRDPEPEVRERAALRQSELESSQRRAAPELTDPLGGRQPPSISWGQASNG